MTQRVIDDREHRITQIIETTLPFGALGRPYIIKAVRKAMQTIATEVEAAERQRCANIIADTYYEERPKDDLLLYLLECIRKGYRARGET